MRYKVTMKSRTERKLVNGNLEVTIPVAEHLKIPNL